MKRFAVLTGDVNASSRMGKQQVRRLEKALRGSFQDLRDNLPDVKAGYFTCFRGDSWQFVVGDAAAAASAAVYFRASLLVRSNDEFGRRMNSAVAIGLGSLDPGITAMLGLIDALIRHLTPSQAKAVCFALRGLTQEEIARRWVPEAVSQQAVQKHLRSAGWPAMEPALEWLYTTINGCKRKNNPEGQTRRERS